MVADLVPTFAIAWASMSNIFYICWFRLILRLKLLGRSCEGGTGSELAAGNIRRNALAALRVIREPWGNALSLRPLLADFGMSPGCNAGCRMRCLPLSLACSRLFGAEDVTCHKGLGRQPYQLGLSGFLESSPSN
jgi:hypothetical protein